MTTSQSLSLSHLANESADKTVAAEEVDCDLVHQQHVIELERDFYASEHEYSVKLVMCLLHHHLHDLVLYSL